MHIGSHKAGSTVIREFARHTLGALATAEAARMSELYSVVKTYFTAAHRAA
jgi:hypothetical protein